MSALTQWLLSLWSLISAKRKTVQEEAPVAPSVTVQEPVTGAQDEHVPTVPVTVDVTVNEEAKEAADGTSESQQEIHS